MENAVWEAEAVELVWNHGNRGPENAKFETDWGSAFSWATLNMNWYHDFTYKTMAQLKFRSTLAIALQCSSVRFSSPFSASSESSPIEFSFSGWIANWANQWTEGVVVNDDVDIKL